MGLQFWVMFQVLETENEPLAIISPNVNSEVSWCFEVKSSLESVRTWRVEDEKFRSEYILEWTLCPECVLIRSHCFLYLCVLITFVSLHD